MNEFTASSGARVVKDFESGTWYSVQVSTVDNKVDLAGVHVDALREFFLTERDETLGRWRWPENPDYVVYRSSEDAVYVFNEGTGHRSNDFSRTHFGWNEPEPGENGLRASARAFFAAHPEPKPWRDANPGEMWLLTYDDESVSAIASSSDSGATVFTAATYAAGGTEELSPRNARITAGRRIYPEV